ncbi:unnamed protein product [Lupinus luteus]|uniref:Phytocyanin domain-containing protein n=1 Tax=Lupinus luteus TaxID=3873 RepID=A0AAV1W3S0_LUPLU
MELQGPLCFVLVLFTLVSISQARIFYVGGNAGWVPNPAENYNQWSGRNRFQINDTLVFKYNNGSDSVLEVTKKDYDGCNKSNPIKKFDDGETEFQFDRTGPFYFISGEDGNCEKGEKLIVVVLAIRGGGKQTQTPPPSTSPPSINTPATSPAPSSGPPAPTPAGSHGPESGPPSVSPAKSPGHSGEPVAPGPAGTGFVPTTSPSSSAKTPHSSPPLSPESAKTPASSNKAAPPANGGASGSPSSLLVYAFTFVVGGALLR